MSAWEGASEPGSVKAHIFLLFLDPQNLIEAARGHVASPITFTPQACTLPVSAKRVE
jgi:hypothetical protein